MKVLLLCAGLGSRLRPYTDDLPKCLLPVKGKSSLERWLDAILLLDPEQVIINSHYLHAHIQDFVEQYVASKSIEQGKIKVAFESLLLGSAGTLYEHKKASNFVVVYSDVYFYQKEAQVLQQLIQEPHRSSMVCVHEDSARVLECGTVTIDQNQLVTDFKEKSPHPTSNLINAGVYYFTEKTLQKLAKHDFDISRDFIPKLLGNLYACVANLPAADIGTVEEYERLNS